ncbi:MAG: hypothetical protein KY432_08215, partial [Acidobacteria bacterium]|nr:hypothetical protein [Acidobacteriota bacterium]
MTGTATFEPERRVLLFLSESEGNQYRTWGGALGKFDFLEHGNETFLVRGLEDGSLCSLLADGTIGHDIVRTPAFVEWVREVAVRGNSDIEYKSSVDHQILSESRRPDVFPSSNHRAAYLLFGAASQGSKPVRWSSPSMSYAVNGTQAGVDGLAGSQAGAAAWNSSGSDVSISTGGSCSVCERQPTDNSEMAIILGGNPGDVPVGENFVAGVQFIYVASPYTLDGESFYPIDHADIIVSSNFSGSQALFDAIVTHEMGHGIGLRHSNVASPSSSDAIMNSSVGPKGANLQLWDLDAVQTVYGDGPECRNVEITSQSSDKTIGYQQSTTLAISVSSSATSPSYQWYTSFTNDFGTATAIAGATSSSYYTGALEEGSYYYWGKTFNDCSSDISSPILVTVNPCITPTIVTEPSDKEISAGSTATLKVTADGSSPLSFQWYRGERGNTSSKVIGATSSTYKTAALNATSTYWVAITNDCGDVESRTVTVTVVGGCDLPTITTHPASQTVVEGTAVNLSVSATSSNGTLSYAWFRMSGETSVPVGSDSPTFTTPPLTAETHYFVNVTDSCGTVVSNVAIIQILGCQVPVIESITPNAFSRWGATETLSVSVSGDEPFTYQWYLGEQGDTSSPIAGATSSTYQTMPLTEKTFFWVRVTNDCGPTDSTTVVIDPLCLPPDAPSIGVVPPEAQTGLPYVVSWTPQPGVSSYELQESSTPDFASVTTYDVEGESRQFVKAVLEPTRFYYRVRGVAECDGSIGGYSPSISVAVVPPPLPTSSEFDVVVPLDTTMPISLTVFIPGLDTDTPFTIETTIDWLTVTPPSGVLPTDGMTFTITADPTKMQLGSNTGSFTLLFGSSGGKQASDSHSSTTPVTVSLVTPVSTGSKTRPSDDSVILLGVAHAAGFGSQWQSDVRLLNIGTSPGGAALKYVPAGAGGSQNVKATAVELKPGVNTAFNDIVKNVYGVGSTGDSQVGSLEIHPSAAGSLATIASSRTFNKSSSGTFGQFMPGIPFFRFIGEGEEGEPKPRLSMQQISQSEKFRTNVA